MAIKMPPKCNATTPGCVQSGTGQPRWHRCEVTLDEGRKDHAGQQHSCEDCGHRW